MPHASQMSVQHMAGDAEFRQWVDAHSAVIQASGMVKTADTGQIAIPCVAVRPAINLAAGYEIYRMDDTQQANFPVFLKIEYGIGSVATRPALYITCGTGTDGAGTITGVLHARATVTRNGTPTIALLYETIASQGEGYFALCSGVTSGSQANYYILGRHIDLNGDPTDNAIFVFHPTTTNSTFYTLMKQPGGLLVSRFGGSSALGPPVLFVTENTNSNEVISLNGEVPLYPFEPFLGRRQPPLLNGCVVHNADVGDGVTFTATMYGGTKTWRRVTDGATALIRGGSSSNGALAIRWEA